MGRRLTFDPKVVVKETGLHLGIVHIRTRRNRIRGTCMPAGDSYSQVKILNSNIKIPLIGHYHHVCLHIEYL